MFKVRNKTRKLNSLSVIINVVIDDFEHLYTQSIAKIKFKTRDSPERRHW